MASKRRDPWLFVRSDSWHVIGDEDHHPGAAGQQEVMPERSPLHSNSLGTLVTFSESEVASRASSTAGPEEEQRTEGATKESIIFQPKDQSPMAQGRSNVVIMPHKPCPGKQQKLLSDILKSAFRDPGPSRLSSKTSSNAEVDSCSKPQITAEKMNVPQLDDYLVSWMKSLGAPTAVVQKKSTEEVLRNCIFQLKTMNKETEPSMAVEVFQNMVALFGISAVGYVFFQLFKNHDVRPAFRNTPDVYLGFGTAAGLLAL